MKPVSGHIIIKDQENKFVFKPFVFFEEGFQTVPLNEVMAYVISNVYGFNIVPPTKFDTVTLTFGNQEVTWEGSLQEYVQGEVIPAHLFTENSFNPQDATKVFLLDVLIGNTDRKADNLLVTPEGSLWAVDNGFSLGFHAETERDKRNPNFYWNLSMYQIENADLEIYPPLLECIDYDYLHELISKIQRTPFPFKTDETDDALYIEVLNMLRYRIKWLPTLVWKQFENRR